MEIKRFKCTLSYDGKNYIGWQKQSNGLGIQEVIEKIFEKIANRKIDIIASGRTDGKVHAVEQIFHFDTDFYLDGEGWMRAIRGYMPKDIYISKIEEVGMDFHARFSATKKEYHYLVTRNEYNVFKKDYSYYCYYPIDVDIMKECAKLFVGTMDYSSFCANSFEIHPNQVRTIYKLEIIEEGNDIRFIFIGKGFLRYMVRMIVGTLLQVARGHLTIDEVKTIIESRDKDACKWNAEAQGLYLVKVSYD